MVFIKKRFTFDFYLVKFKQYIQKSEIKGINKTKLEKTIIDLYNEAINLE